MRSLHRPEQVIENWFDIMSEPGQATARAAHAAVLALEPKLYCSIKWGQLVYAWNGYHVMALAAYKGHLHLQVLHGASIAGDLPELRGRGRGVRFIELRHAQPIDEDVLRRVVGLSVAQAQATASRRYGASQASEGERG
jgi:hypothetical protein